MPSIIIAAPHGFTGPDYSTNQDAVTFSGTFSVTGSASITYVHSYKNSFGLDTVKTTGSVSTVTGSNWVLLNNLLEVGENLFTFTLSDTGSSATSVARSRVTFTNANRLGVIVDPPTALSVDRYTDKVVVSWLGNGSITYSEKNITFVSGAFSEGAIPGNLYSSYRVSVEAGVHTPTTNYLTATQVKAGIVDSKLHNVKLVPSGSSPTTSEWKLPSFAYPVKGDGRGQQLTDVKALSFSGLPSGVSGVSLSGNKITFSAAISTGTTITTSYFYNQLRTDDYVVTVESAGPGGVGTFSVSGTKFTDLIAHAELNLGLSSVTDSAWSPSLTWVNQKSDLQTSPGAPAERVTVNFTSPLTFNVSSSVSSGTSGIGVVGRTFYYPDTGLRFTVADTGLYTSGDSLVFDIESDPIFTAGDDIILDIPGLELRVLDTINVGVRDTAIVKTLASSEITPPSNGIPIGGAIAREQVVLTEKGAVDINTLRVTTAESDLAERTTYQLGVHYTLLNSEDVNYPTRIVRLVYPSEPNITSIGLDVPLLASFQVFDDVAIKGYNVYGSIDPAGGLSGYKKLNTHLLASPSNTRDVVASSETTTEMINGVRITTTQERILKLNEYQFSATDSFLADPAILGNRTSTDLSTYFVVTAVASDNAARRTEVESVYSVEVVGKPIEITNQVQEFTPRTFDEVVEDYLSSALAAQPLLDIKPTSITRDIHIDPVANELEKAYLMLDFVNKSQSFLTLMSLDDPNGTGASEAGTEYKASLQLVFGLETETEVQALIDSQFDKLAANVNVTRLGAQSARGTVKLSSLSAPLVPLVVTSTTTFSAPTSSGNVLFRSLIDLRVEVEQFVSYFNTSTGRYEIDIPVIAAVAGSAGNLDAGTVTKTSLPNFFVTNESPMVFGSDIESNKSLAERSLIALMGVDHGTIGGYIKEVVSNPGVLKVTSQGAGSPFMLRDYDPIRKVHLGGKVDLYVQGNLPLVYQEEFGLQFLRSTEVKDVNSGTPYLYVLANKVENVFSAVLIKKGQDDQLLDLDNLAIVDKTVTFSNLSETNKNVLTNAVSGDQIRFVYYYAGDFDYKFKHQPVLGISSVSWSAGTLTEDNYTLKHTDDFFLYGNSAQSQSYLSLAETSGVEFIARTFEESATMAGTLPVTLSQYGVDLDSISVSIGSTGYTRGIHFDVVEDGSTTTKTQLARRINVNNGIPDGATVTIEYNASDTFVVQYQVQSIVESIQQSLEAKEYATADVLVKQANEVPVDISANIILQKGINQSDVDLRIRTALGRYFANLRLGDAVYQSDVIRVLDGVSGVYAVDTPILKLLRADDSYVIGDLCKINTANQPNGQAGPIRLSRANNQVLTFSTINGGGLLSNAEQRSVGVYLGSLYLKGVKDLDALNATLNSCCIQVEQSKSVIYINNNVLTGNSSLLADITSGKVQVRANYFTYSESDPDQVHDLPINDFEYASLGNLLFSYRTRS